MSNGCPCLLQWAVSPVLSRDRRTLSWTCGECGEWNTEVRQHIGKNVSKSLHGGPLADSLMGSTVASR